MEEYDLLAAIREAPDDDAPRLVYADWLLAHGDARGALIILDRRDAQGALDTRTGVERLLELASIHGFPRLPHDPCAHVLRFSGVGSFPTQYHVTHEGHDHDLRWRYGFTIDVDDVTVFEGHLDTLTTNEWTFRETNVILAIVSAAIRAGAPLADLVFPDQAGFLAHPSFHLGRSPSYGFPESYDTARSLEVRDFGRWHGLYRRRQRLLGIEPPPLDERSCACGVEGLSCGVLGCDLSATTT